MATQLAVQGQDIERSTLALRQNERKLSSEVHYVFRMRVRAVVGRERARTIRGVLRGRAGVVSPISNMWTLHHRSLKDLMEMQKEVVWEDNKGMG